LAAHALALTAAAPMAFASEAERKTASGSAPLVT